MSKFFSYFLVFVMPALLFGFSGWYLAKYPLKSTLIPQTVKEKLRPLDKFTYDALSNRNWEVTPMQIEGPLEYKPTTIRPPYKFNSHIFSTTVNNKKVTGQINIPTTTLALKGETLKGYPVILMLRGYAPLENYQTGVGTRPSAAVFAQNGFVTVAPDFFGYGGSDPRSTDEMEARFESYVIALQLLYNLSRTSELLFGTTHYPLITNHLFLWGHSNGGHLAIATLEMANHSPSFAGQTFPTVLWAPVSKPFPYSVLVYEDEADDLGKQQRKSLSNFEADYDANLYSVHNYLDWLQSPIQLHQGTADEEVPYWWSKDFANNLKSRKKDITLFLYSGANHNLTPAWNTAISRTLSFFKTHIK
ncbi:MAG: hypothetical protein A2782_03510 [Candidatus Blackburnbacteria bacterium RIFCSPHIGHO2_01_FULL_43_15b]|uniref:Peptidase S9 prolyl oligopeptidase catalytic domain-containing protein n=1 Tax=Candidatus Blackburnbacteria bacterium RIFCSPHIGHO2_01_FULL_43_15b TaxID=1797513 RepID=A0A1G1V019_9BACT|nr:MAG: hypothetical protein A2782_03510 [Candidatus Blackburnbacteria bacterium RIFCSPHIGHO2_01_FULL_43_15b]